MSKTFTYDVFISHSSKDKAVVRGLAEQLKSDGCEYGSMNVARLRDKLLR